MRNQFTFYKSFDDVIEELDDKQIAEYIRKMLDVQFLRVKVENIEFKDKLLSAIWKSQKHSIQTSINGYLDSQKKESCKNPFFGCYDDNNTPYEGGSEYPCEGGLQQEQDKDKEQGKWKGKEEDKEQLNNTDFSLFWSAYPKKEGKGQAEKAWSKAKKSKDFPIMEEILRSIERYKQTDAVNKGFIKNPSTWINGKCWLDESNVQRDCWSEDRHEA